MTLATGGSGSVGAANWRYQGRLDISPAGLSTPLYSAGARDYSPALGTFISFDSTMGKAADPISMNRYLYAAANPATLIDPDGHCASRNIDLCDSQNEQAANKAGQKNYKSKWAGDGGSGAAKKAGGQSTGAVAPQNTPRADTIDDGYTKPVSAVYRSCHRLGCTTSSAAPGSSPLDQVLGGVWDATGGLVTGVVKGGLALGKAVSDCQTAGIIMGQCGATNLAGAFIQDPGGTTRSIESKALHGLADSIGGVHDDLASGDLRRITRASFGILLNVEAAGLSGGVGGGARGVAAVGEVVDAAEAGAGAAVAVSEGDSLPLVIGEGMQDRVIPYAEEAGAGYYAGAPLDTPEELLLEHNRAALQEAMAAGRKIIDIGPHPARPNFPYESSANYLMEHLEIEAARYTNVTQVKLDEWWDISSASAH